MRRPGGFAGRRMRSEALRSPLLGALPSDNRGVFLAAGQMLVPCVRKRSRFGYNTPE